VNAKSERGEWLRLLSSGPYTHFLAFAFCGRRYDEDEDAEVNPVY